MAEFMQELDFGDLQTEKENLSRVAPAGTYDLVFTKWEYRESRAKGTPGVNFEFKTINCDEPEWNNFSLFHWCGGGTFFFKQAILAIFKDRLEELNDLDSDSQEYEDAKLKLLPEEVKNNECPDLDEAQGSIVTGEIIIDTYTPEDGDAMKSNKIKKFLL